MGPCIVPSYPLLCPTTGVCGEEEDYYVLSYVLTLPLMLPLLLTHVGLCAMLCTHEGSYGPLYPLYVLMRGCMCHHIITTWDTAGHHY